MRAPILLQINASVNTGSTGRIAEEIGQRAIAEGYVSYIAYGREARESQSRLIRIGSKWDILFHGLISFLGDAHGLGSRHATLKLVDEIERISPDIILFHNLHGYYLNIEILITYLKKKRIPLFWTLHDCWPFTGHCSFFDAYNCEKWKTHCGHCPNSKGYPKSLFFDNSTRNFDKKKALLSDLASVSLVPVCQWMSNVVADSFMKMHPRFVVYNGTDISVFSPQKRNEWSETRKRYCIDRRFVVLGVASTWDKRKGLNDFLWLASQLPQDYQIVLVGLSKEQVRCLPATIIGIKRTESVHELASLYSLSDVFVNPTYVDNFPTTNIEALACGTPVVTYHTGGSPEAIDYSTGIVVSKGDRERLKQAILKVVSNPNLYPREACRKRAVEHYDKEQRFGDYIDLFNRALGKD